MHTVHITVQLMGFRFGTGEGGKNHSMLTTKKLDYTTGRRGGAKSSEDCIEHVRKNTEVEDFQTYGRFSNRRLHILRRSDL